MKRLLYAVFLHPSVFISAMAAFFCFTVNVSTIDLGGISGTIVVQADTSPESIYRMVTLLRLSTALWLLIFIFAFLRAWRKEV